MGKEYRATSTHVFVVVVQVRFSDDFVDAVTTHVVAAPASVTKEEEALYEQQSNGRVFFTRLVRRQELEFRKEFLLVLRYHHSGRWGPIKERIDTYVEVEFFGTCER